MNDRERILHGLHSCGCCDGISNICGVTECPYESDKPWCTHNLAHDTFVLLRELLEPTARVYEKRELGSIHKDTIVWVENREAMPGYKLDIQCFQGISDMHDGNGGWETCAEYMCGFDEVKDYGVEWRMWTARPTEEQMRETLWQE